MLEIKKAENHEILLSGRFDASQVDRAQPVFDSLSESAVLNFKDLEYVSSAGLSVLLVTQKRLSETGHRLKIIHMSKHIRDVFRYAGFDVLFEIV